MGLFGGVGGLGFGVGYFGGVCAGEGFMRKYLTTRIELSDILYLIPFCIHFFIMQFGSSFFKSWIVSKSILLFPNSIDSNDLIDFSVE